MRRSEMTPELIELSKRAKELGFPQDVEKGDWIYDDDGDFYLIAYDGLKEDMDILILSFSRCLEWLRGKEYTVRLESRDTDYHKKRGWTAGVTVLKGEEWDDLPPDFYVHHNAKTHHEAIAKCCVRILEGEKDATVKR